MRRIGIAALVALGILAAAPAPAQDAPPPPSPGAALPPQSEVSPPPAASPLQDAVHLTPAPHVSLLIPKGWYACDADVNAKLGGVNVPMDFKTNFCGPSLQGDWTMRVINLNLTQLMFAITGVFADPLIRADMFDRMSPELLQKSIDTLCTSVRQSQGMGAPDCRMQARPFAGRTSLVGQVVGTRTGSPEKIYMRVVGIPMKGSLFLFIIADTETSHSVTGPIVDAIVDSIAVE